MAKNPYTNLYPTTNTGKELDLRTEMYRTLYGAVDEVAKGRLGLLRRMRKDDDNKLIPCPCRDSVTDEPDKDYYCRYCLGMGYFWDEVRIVYYRNDDSFRKREGKNEEFEGDDFFVEYSAVVTPQDYIVTVKLAASGSPIVPVTRDKLFKILSADPFRSDSGRIEFWRIRAIEERNWSIWYGNETRQRS